VRRPTIYSALGEELSYHGFRRAAPGRPSDALGRILIGCHCGNEGCRIVDADCKAIGTALDAERAVNRDGRAC
jgi:hypothetical protein